MLDSSYEFELERLEHAARAAGTTPRTFFQHEIDARQPATSSTAMAAPSRATGEVDEAKTTGKGKGKAKGKQGGKGKHKGKEKPAATAPDLPHQPTSPPRRERPVKQGELKHVKQEETEHKDINEHSNREEEADWSGEPSPTTSPLPVGTIPAGTDRIDLGTAGGPPPTDPHTVSYLGWRAAVRARRKHSIEILTTDGIVGGDNKEKGKGKGGKSKGKRTSPPGGPKQSAL
jgi:hypothetical protein